MNKFLGVVLLGGALAVLPLARAAEDPSLQDVNAAVRSGHLEQAQSMMQTVLRAHPNSAKAHFVEAEVLVRLARTDEARSELARAEQIEPGLPSIRSESVQVLRARLAAGEAPLRLAPAVPPAPPAPSFPWAPVLLLLGIGAVIVLALRARRAAQSQVIMPAGAAPYGAGGAAPYGSPYGAPMGGGIGSGILGGLATGAAVGAGMVAGEALAHDLMGNHERAQSGWGDDGARQASADTSDLGVDGNWDSGGGGDIASGIGGDDWG
jgi:hypothetical protein